MDGGFSINGGSRRWGLPLALLLALSILTIDFAPDQPACRPTAAIAVLMATLWMTEAIPLAATALLPVFLFPAFGVMSGKVVAGHYFNHIIFLFLGGFLVAIAMQRWNLHRRIALRILLLFGVNPRRLLLGFMVATGFLSMWISNTAAAMMMTPIIMAVAVKLEESFDAAATRKFVVGLLLGVAYSASIGGVATLVGTPPNPVFIKILALNFPDAPEISFAQWFAFAAPVSLVFGVVVWGWLSWMFRPEQPLEIDESIFRKEYDDLGRMAYEEWVVALVFGALAFLWMTRADISLGESLRVPGWSNFFPYPDQITDGSVGIALASLLFMIPSRNAPQERVMPWDAVLKLPWDIVLLFGGGFALAHGFKESGLSAWVGGELTGLAGLSPVISVALICLFCTFLTELTSNTATAQTVLPILASLSVAVGLHPLLVMVPATLSLSFAFMLPVATPPNAIVFGSGRIRVVDMMRAGFALNIIGVVILTAAIFFLGPLVFGAGLGASPPWATLK